MPATTIRILLSRVKWDKRELLDHLTGENRNKFLAECISDPFAKPLEQKKSSQEIVTCQICCSESIETVSLTNNR